MRNLQYLGEDYHPDGRRWAVGIETPIVLFTFRSPWAAQHFLSEREDQEWYSC